LVKIIQDGEEALAAGKIQLTEGYDIAVKEMKSARIAIQMLLSERNASEQNSAEGVAEQQRFNYLVSRCTLNNETGQPIFENKEDYLTRSEEPWAFQAAAIFSQLNNGLDADYLGSLPENKFLKTWGFVDEYYRLVNKEGELVDEENKLINEIGQWVNSEGELVDEQGKRLDEEGFLVIDENVVFYDLEGNPLTPPKPKAKKAEKVENGVQSSSEESSVEIPETEAPDEADVVEDVQKKKITMKKKTTTKKK